MRRFKAILIAILVLVCSLSVSQPSFAAEEPIKTKLEIPQIPLEVPDVFIKSDYMTLNPLVVTQYNGDINKIYQHYVTQGIHNGERMYSTPQPTATEALMLYVYYNKLFYLQRFIQGDFSYFNPAVYAEKQRDVVLAHGTDGFTLLAHYLNHGIFESRPSGSNQDIGLIIRQNPSYATQNSQPLLASKIMQNYSKNTGFADTTGMTVPQQAEDASKQTANTEVAQAPHEHQYYYSKLDDSKHLIKCRSCDYVEKAEHRFHVKTIGSEGHILECKKCALRLSAPHSDANHDCQCDICGYELSPAHVHEYITFVSANTDSHTYQCSCGETQTSNHNWIVRMNEDQPGKHDIACSVCNTVKGTYDCDTNGTDGCCSECGYKASTSPDVETEHNYSYTPNNDGTHNGICTNSNCAGNGTITNEPCDGNPNQACSKCGYVGWPIETEHHYEYTSNLDGTHNGVCTNPNCTDDEYASIGEEPCDNHDEVPCSKCGFPFVNDSGDHDYDPQS